MPSDMEVVDGEVNHTAGTVRTQWILFGPPSAIWSHSHTAWSNDLMTFCATAKDTVGGYLVLDLFCVVGILEGGHGFREVEEGRADCGKHQGLRIASKNVHQQLGEGGLPEWDVLLRTLPLCEQCGWYAVWSSSGRVCGGGHGVIKLVRG